MPSSPVLESSPKLQISAPPLGQSGKGITYSHSPYKLNASLSGSYAETGTRRVSEQGSPLISVGSLGGRATPDVTDARGSHPGSLPIQVRPHDGDSMPNVQARYSRRGGGSPCLPSSLTQRQHVNPSAMSAFPTSPVGGGPVPQPSSVEEGSLYGSYHQQHTYPQSCPPQRRMQQSTPYGYAENALTNNNQASPFLMTPPAHSSPPVSVDSSALRHSKPRNGSTPMSSPYNSYQGNSQLAQHHTNSATYAPPNFVLPDGSSTMAAQNSSTNGYRSTSAPGESHLLHSSSSGTYAPRNSQINMRTAPPVPGNNNSTYHGAPAAAHPAEPQNFDSHTTNSHHVTGGTHSALSSLRLTAPGAAARSQALDVSCSSPSEKSSSSRSSFRDELPLCPSDGSCANINDRKHQRKFAHTCRLFPCYHGHVKRHAHLFRHVAGQISQPESGSPANISATALTSVNFSTISPEAPNAYRIYVSRGDQSYEIFGGWASVKVHTFKRYLHQVYHLAPPKQVLIVSATGRVMEDDIRTVQSYGVEEGCVIDLRSTLEERVDIPIEDL